MIALGAVIGMFFSLSEWTCLGFKIELELKLDLCEQLKIESSK
jgi:hypothetical protein